MSKLLLSLLVVGVLVTPSGRTCSCRAASEDDIAHGANEDIEYHERTVKNLEGTVSYQDDGARIPDVVVELYDVTDADRNLRPRQIVGLRSRRAACITGGDGTFCFPNVPSGLYVLRAGTRSSNGGMNDVCMRIKLDNRWWTGWFRRARPIKLGLSPGT